MTPRARLYVVLAISLLFFTTGATALYCLTSYFQGKDLNARAYRELLAGNVDAAIPLYDQASRKLLDAEDLALVYGNRAWCYMKKGMNEQAIRDFTESIRLDPRPVYSVLDRGLVYQRAGEYEKAVADYDTTIAKDPNQTDALYNRGLIFADRGDWSRAIADFTEAIRCEPRNAQFFVERGMAFAATNQLDAAIANFDAALALYPIHAGAYIQRAAAYLRKGDGGKGIADITEAIRQRPNVVRLFYARAYIYLERGAIAEAIADCDEANRMDPGYDLAYLARARAFAHMRDWTTTLSDAETALKLTPNSEWGHYLRGYALTHLGEFDEAIAEFETALKLDPADIHAIVWRAENYAYRHEYSRARDDLRRAVERFRGAAAAHLGLAWFLATCPHDAYRDGEEAVAEALKACDLSNWNLWYAFDTLAAAYAEHGEFEKAIRFANQALALPNASSQERYLIEQRLAGYTIRIAARDLPPSRYEPAPIEKGINAYARKDYDRAIAQFNTILPPNPGGSMTARWYHFFDGTYSEPGRAPSALFDRRDRANAFYYRARAYEKKDQLENAIADFSTSLSLEPDSAMCLRDRGYVYYQKRAYGPALEDFDEAIRRAPDDALAHCYRAEALSGDHQRDAALEAVNTALRIDPKLGEAYFTRGWIHRARKEYDLALADFEKADSLEPNHQSTLAATAQTLSSKGDYQAATQEYRTLVLRFPKSAEARNSRAWFLATCPEARFRDGIEAINEARTACELSRWDDAGHLDTLAAAYAENGEFDQAVKYATRALEKLNASDPDRPHLMQHLEGFRRKEAWRAKAEEG